MSSYSDVAAGAVAAQTSRMARKGESAGGLGPRIDEARQYAKLTLTALGVEVGVGRSAVSQWISETTDPTAENLRKAAMATGVSYEWLATGRGQMAPPPTPHEPAHNYAPPPDILGARDLPVYAAVEGGRGQMVVSTDPIELVPRPWYMREVRDGYAVLVVGESMVPAFEPGQMAIVNPRLPPQRDADAILVSGEQEGEFTASIKRLVNWTAQEWRVRQFNPKKEFTLLRREWPKALRVVGKYYGG